MTPTVLIVGIDPDLVDYNAPGIPPGLNADLIRAGLAIALEDAAARGWRVEQVYTDLGETAGRVLAERLEAVDPDCVVIGAGVRAPGNLMLLEDLLNVVHRKAPRATIAFNTRPDDSAAAAARRLGL